jgi:hypothetical protein
MILPPGVHSWVIVHAPIGEDCYPFGYILPHIAAQSFETEY